MSRQPRLDTSLRQQAYSYVETPIEMSPPGFHPSNSTDITTDQTTAYNNQASTTDASEQGRPQTHPDAINVASQELEQARQMRLQERQALALSTTSLTEHPALSAPYAEGDTPKRSLPAQPSTQYQAPPYSPGPLPEKRPTDFEYTSPQKIYITPDTNPLQSPRSPIHRMGTIPSTNQESQPVHEAHPNHQPGQIAHPNQIVIGGHWSTGLCECADVGTCCLGLSCPCILYGRTQYRLLRKSRGEDPTNLLGYETCNGSCTSMAFFCGCQWLLATIQHTRTRKAYDIEGNVCSDCVRASCCMCCTFIRNEREIKRREENRAYSAQLTRSTFVTPYLPPGQMHYRPNSD